jgi:hypothetical protein
VGGDFGRTDEEIRRTRPVVVRRVDRLSKSFGQSSEAILEGGVAVAIHARGFAACEDEHRRCSTTRAPDREVFGAVAIRVAQRRDAVPETRPSRARSYVYVAVRLEVDRARRPCPP